jgi:hypothetical protein
MALSKERSSGPLQEAGQKVAVWRGVQKRKKQHVPLIGGRSQSPLRLDVYVWPLIEQAQHGSGKLLVRQAFSALHTGE